MDAITIGEVDYTTLAIIIAVSGSVAAAIVQMVKVAYRARIKEQGATFKRPWYWAWSLRVISVTVGIISGMLVSVMLGSYDAMELLQAGIAGSLGGFFSTAIAKVVIDQLDKRGIKVSGQDTLEIQVGEDDGPQ